MLKGDTIFTLIAFAIVENPYRLKTLIPIPIYCLLFAWLSVSWISPANDEITTRAYPAGNGYSLNDSSSVAADEMDADALYEMLDLDRKGLSRKAFEYALKGYHHLLEKRLISKPGYLTICDFSQSSKHKRLYLLDMVNNEVLINTYVAHGRNSGGEFASRFSNRPSSLQSSLGFFLTANTYMGENGFSLRVRGLEPGYNDKAMARHIVIHGAGYIDEQWLIRSSTMGRSYGCPAVPQDECAPLINTIKDGSVLFIYHPSANYLKHSKILNG